MGMGMRVHVLGLFVGQNGNGILMVLTVLLHGPIGRPRSCTQGRKWKMNIQIPKCGSWFIFTGKRQQMRMGRWDACVCANKLASLYFALVALHLSAWLNYPCYNSQFLLPSLVHTNNTWEDMKWKWGINEAWESINHGINNSQLQPIITSSQVKSWLPGNEPMRREMEVLLLKFVQNALRFQFPVDFNLCHHDHRRRRHPPRLLLSTWEKSFPFHQAYTFTVFTRISSLASFNLPGHESIKRN